MSMFLWRNLTPAAIASAAAALTRESAPAKAPVTPVAKAKPAASRQGIAKS
ncbi:MAG: hypothetical protein ACM3Q1_03155 [Bacteroidales bacterium]